MNIDDTDAVAKRYGRVTPVQPHAIQVALNIQDWLKADFQDGDSVYHYGTCEALAGTFGYLLVRNGKIVGRYSVGMS